MEVRGDVDYKLFHSRIKVQRYWIRARIKKILELAFSCKARNVLDIGCGTGMITEFLGKTFNSVGVDIDKNCIKYAVRRIKNRKISFAVGSANHLPFKNKSFDLIVAAELIEHTNKYTTINEIKRILKSGGCLVLSTPNYFSTWSLIEFFWSKTSIEKRYESREHISKFNYFSLKEFLQKNEFVIEKIETTHLILPFLVFLPLKNAVSIDKEMAKIPFGMLCFVKAKLT